MSRLDSRGVSLQVREAWQMYELDLINYQNKCRLIRGWDDLFTKVKEHINSVAAMKLSPYFKVNAHAGRLAAQAQWIPRYHSFCRHCEDVSV